MVNLSWQDAIIRVLEEAGKPLHYADIAQAVIDGGLRDNVGATPANTVASVVSQSIKDLEDGSPFFKLERGIYGLRAAGPEEPALEAHDEAEEDAERMGLINAFGMFWRRDLVIWAPTEPQLLGQQQAGSDAINFAAQTGVYILYDGDRVIYVGRVTGERLSKRLKEHTRDRLNGRWDRFSWFGVRRPAASGELQNAPDAFDLDNLVATMEALLIEGLEPPQNRRQGDKFNAVEFIQIADPQIEREQMRKLLIEVSKSI
ncbi:HTH domain-containing protein [Actinoplanes sp. CA-015351]|uniref:HTH domain-containing protein n=1 Tax=Actinoplanes sp. CA-015351 TaxID=3239897 RepID=UPI003D995502